MVSNEDLGAVYVRSCDLRLAFGASQTATTLSAMGNPNGRWNSQMDNPLDLLARCVEQVPKIFSLLMLVFSWIYSWYIVRRLPSTNPSRLIRMNPWGAANRWNEIPSRKVAKPHLILPPQSLQGLKSCQEKTLEPRVAFLWGEPYLILIKLQGFWRVFCHQKTSKCIILPQVLV